MHGAHVRRATGMLFLAALGLMVLAIAVAQPEASAETRGVFKVSGESVSSALGVKVVGAPEGPVAFVVPNLNVEVVCFSFLTVGGELLAEGIGALKFLYEKCTMWIIEGAKSEHKLTEPMPCTIEDAVLDALLLVISHGERTYLLAEGKKNAKGETLPLLTVKFLGKEEEIFCPFGKTLTFRGTEAFELPAGDLQKGPEVVKVLIRPASPAAQGLLKDKFVLGVEPVTVEGGSVNLTLTGAHNGLAWGAI